MGTAAFWKASPSDLGESIGRPLSGALCYETREHAAKIARWYGWRLFRLSFEAPFSASVQFPRDGTISVFGTLRSAVEERP